MLNQVIGGEGFTISNPGGGGGGSTLPLIATANNIPVLYNVGSAEIIGIDVNGYLLLNPSIITLPNSSNIQVGSWDNGHGGTNGLSLNCVIGYELNWQAGYLSMQAPAGGSPASGNYSVFCTDAGLTTSGIITFQAIEAGTGIGTLTGYNFDKPITIASQPVITGTIGTSANEIVQLDSSAKLPAVDGSQLTNLPGGSGYDPTAVAITGGTIDGTEIGATTPALIIGTDIYVIGALHLNHTLGSFVIGTGTFAALGNVPPGGTLTYTFSATGSSTTTSPLELNLQNGLPGQLVVQSQSYNAGTLSIVILNNDLTGLTPADPSTYPVAFSGLNIS